MSEFPHQPLERQFADQQVGALLVLANLSNGDGAWTEPVGLLYAALHWRSLPSDLLGHQLLAGDLLGC